MRKQAAALVLLAGLASMGAGVSFAAQAAEPQTQQPPAKPELQTTEDWNRRLKELTSGTAVPKSSLEDYRLGPQDLLEITVFEAPELNRTLRISSSGEIFMPLLEGVRAAGLTPRELEYVLQELLRRKFIKDPHVSVFVKEMESHAVSVFGAVKQPGVFQIRGSKPLVEMLSLAGGLDQDAGDSVIVVRGERSAEMAKSNAEAGETAQKEASKVSSGGENSIEISLKALLDTGDPASNINVYPGDTIKVTRAGIVYVIGEVRRPGGYTLRSNENITVLQALALAEGLTRTASKGKAKIIRTDEKSGARSELALDLNRVLDSKAPDLMLQPRDILFVPNSSAKAAIFRGTEATISVLSGVLIYRTR